MATRYWVGGTGAWDIASTINWSDSSGGANGFSAPAIGDDVIFDASSGGGTVTVGTGFNPSMNSLTMGAFTGTLTFAAFNNSPTMVSFSGSGTGTRTLLMGSGTWTITGSGTCWDLTTTTNLIFNRGTSTIKLTDTTTSNKTFAGGGAIYYDFWLSTTNTGYLVIEGSNTFFNLKADPGREIRFTDGTTTTIDGFGFLTLTKGLKGTAGNLITLRGTSTGGWTISRSASTQVVDYCSISYSTASGGATWQARNSTSVIGNSGWVFPSAPTVLTYPVNGINRTTSIGNGNVTSDGLSTITERGVCWKISTGPTTADSKSYVGGQTGVYTATMAGLSADTLYYVKAYVITPIGTAYGAEVTFTTLKANKSYANVINAPVYDGNTTGQILDNGTGTIKLPGTNISQWTTNGLDIYFNDRVFIGASSEATSGSKLYLTGTTAINGSIAGLIGLYQIHTFNPTAGGIQGVNRIEVTNSATTLANTAVGQTIRISDNATGLTTLIRGIDVTTALGSNSAGTNTAIRGYGYTFGVQGVTNGAAGGLAVPAAGFFENTGTTQGNCLRCYTNSMTSAPSIFSMYQVTSTYTGTAVDINMADGSGGFTGNFLNMKLNTSSKFLISYLGNVSIGGTAVRGTTVGTNALNIFNGTAPVGTLTNGCSVYSSAGELYTMDAAGNATLQTPHDEDNYWVFDSTNTVSGKRVKIDMEKMMRFLNEKFGTDFVHDLTNY